MNKQVSGTHERLVVEEVVTGSSNRAFGLTFALVFAFVGLWPLVRGRPVRGWAVIVAAIFLLAALAIPLVLSPLKRLWLKFGLLLHACMSPVIMGLVSYSTVTPMGIVGRMLGWDPLRLRFESDALTYWIERDPPGPTPDTMPRQF